MKITLDRTPPKPFFEMTEEEMTAWIEGAFEEDTPLTKEQAKTLREALGRMREGGPGSGHHGHAGTSHEAWTILLRGRLPEMKGRKLNLEDFRRLVAGGPGSGHHGHAGRPGIRGGSLPGIASGKKDVIRSSRMKKECNAQPKMCWWNAIKSHMTLSREEVVETEYVEGLFVVDFPGFKYPLEHGWLKTKNGTILDPTLPTDTGIYFEAKTWPIEEAWDLVFKDNKRPPFIRYDDPAWRGASEAANKYAFSEFVGVSESTDRLAEALFRKVRK